MNGSLRACGETREGVPQVTCTVSVEFSTEQEEHASMERVHGGVRVHEALWGLVEKARL